MNDQHHAEAPQVAVRQATILDLDLLVPMFDAYRRFYRKPGDLDLARRFLLERFQHNESIIFLAVRQDGSAAGFTQLLPSFSSASAARILILNDLYVRPEARRKGVGALLLAAAAGFGRGIGAVRLTLATEVTNEAAQALYEAGGVDAANRLLRVRSPYRFADGVAARLNLGKGGNAPLNSQPGYQA